MMAPLHSAQAHGTCFSPLAHPSATREVLDRFGMATKHRLGQNFLINDEVIGKILALAELGEKDVVLEVGPGIGTLTVALLAHARAVCSIEADDELEAVLPHTCADFVDRFALVMGDALRVCPEQVERALAECGVVEVPAKLVSNLPYQVAATVILRTLRAWPSIERLVVMVQAEVADRICACPGNKTYGAYTAKLSLFGKVTGRFEVPPHCFMPAPHVDSAVVRIDRALAADAAGVPLTSEQLEQTASVIDASFAQRRKTIRNCLASSGVDRGMLDEALAAAGIAPTCRAETLATDDFIRLAGELANRSALPVSCGRRSQER